jgi:hypothetical protein
MSSPAQASAASTPMVRCPYCLFQFRWDGHTLFRRTPEGDYVPLDVDQTADPIRREDRLREAYVHCPDSSGVLAHYLPLDYLRYRQPLVIGLVGTAAAGKSTLLAVMVNEIDRGGLNRYQFTARPLVHERHEAFRHSRLKSLIQDGTTLGKTAPATENVEFADAFLLVRDTHVQPIVFFDVGGESLAEPGPATRFIQAVNALVFVVDPDRVLGRTRGSVDADGRAQGDAAFKAVLDTLIASSGAPSQFLDIPAAIVLAKADTLRFEPPVARWLRDQDGSVAKIDAGQLRAESRDVFAFLYEHDAGPWLEPFNRFRRCTLHVVSATGSNPDASYTYRHGLRPRRVLEPLMAILAMAGAIDGPEASQVGR